MTSVRDEPMEVIVNSDSIRVISAGTQGPAGPATVAAGSVITVKNRMIVGDPTGTPISVPILINVCAYGAVGDGSTDCTTAIEAAWTEAIASRQGLYFPPGTYNYNGTGLTGNAYPVIVGDGPQTSIINLGSTSYLINNAALTGTVTIYGIGTVGGYGVFRNTYTGVNVQGNHNIDNCRFYQYTRVAVEENASDNPYWQVSRTTFWGNDYLLTMGAALSGLLDQSAIRDCSFLMNRVNIKLREGGGNALIDNCDLIRFGTDRTNGPAIDLWIVPDPSYINAGRGTAVRKCKFGNENLVSGDYRVLIADELSGTTIGERFPDLVTTSTGYVDGLTFSDTTWGMSGASEPMSFCYAMTPNVRGPNFGNIVISGGPTKDGNELIEFASGALPLDDYTNTTGRAGPIHQSTIIATPPQGSNSPGFLFMDDPNHILQAWDQPRRGAGTPANYVNLLSTAVASFFPQDTTVIGAAEADGLGGTDATEAVLQSGSGFGMYADLATGSIKIGVPVWVVFDVKKGAAGTPASQIRVAIGGPAGDRAMRVYPVPPSGKGWTTYAFPFLPRVVGAYMNIRFEQEEGAARTVKLGRARVYHATERVPGDFQGVANADTSGATLGQLETEVNELKALLRKVGMMAT